MRFEVPHPIPYQGSKRRLAFAILSFIPRNKFERLIEPFAGSAAVTLAAASKSLCERFLIADVLAPLADIWRQIVFQPEKLIADYRVLWCSQLKNPRKRFDEIRDDFNREAKPAKLLFLLARCVKNSVRFNPLGKFNQSPDNRRLGTRPESMEKEIRAAHCLLTGRCVVLSADFRDTLKVATPKDLVYMDPPYQGTSYGRDRRYFRAVDRDSLIESLEDLNRRGIQYLVSYDGSCGRRTYGLPLPDSLGAHRVILDAGRSSQGTLNGRSLRTRESLYVSSGLCDAGDIPEILHFRDAGRPARLFQ